MLTALLGLIGASALYELFIPSRTTTKNVDDMYNGIKKLSYTEKQQLFRKIDANLK